MPDFFRGDETVKECVSILASRGSQMVGVQSTELMGISGL